MKWWALALPALAVAAFGAYEFGWIPRDSAAGGCDRSLEVPGFHCEACNRVLEASELFSGDAWYECGRCGRRAGDPGACRSCGSATAQRPGVEGACPRCFQPPEPATICVKQCFECPRCGDRAPGPGACEACNRELAQTSVRALVQYECGDVGCSERSIRPGVCGRPECRRHGRPLVPACSESGLFPHGEVGR